MIHTIQISTTQLELFQTLLSNPGSLTESQYAELEALSECFSDIITENDSETINYLVE